MRKRTKISDSKKLYLIIKVSWGKSIGFHEMERETLKYYKHLLAHLPIVKDPTLVILRGHLLLEELLDEVLKAWLKDPSVLSDTRLTFHQKMKLSKGIISGGRDGFTWKPVDLLNQLRNRISHRLSPHDLELKIDEFLKCVYPEDYRDIPSDIYSKSKAMRKAIRTFNFIGKKPKKSYLTTFPSPETPYRGMFRNSFS